MKKNLIAFLVLLNYAATAQTGGDNTYEFLNLPSAARIASMGGVFVSVKDNDINLVLQNPSALNNNMHNQLAFNYVDYLSDIKYGYVACARNYDKIASFAVGLDYLNYGKFIAADANGIQTGTFSAAEYALNMSASRPFGDSLFSVGATVKLIYSQLESYNSFGIASDIGLNYYNPEKEFCITLVARNIGTQITTYTPGNHEPLPFQIDFGISKRLSKAPFRFNLNITHLEKFDITYDNPNSSSQTDPVTGEPVTDKITTGNKIMRHMIPGLEVLLSKNFHLRFAYNFQRRRELGIDSKMGMVGFSGGIGLKIAKFHLSYARSVYSLAGGTNTFSIAFDLDEFGPKKK